jgi:hypothetical protein
MYHTLPFNKFIKFIDTQYRYSDFPYLHLILISEWSTKNSEDAYCKLKYLVSKHDVINKRNDFNGITACFIPKTLSNIKRLVELGARLDIIDYDGASVMYHHFTKRNMEIITWLCDEYINDICVTRVYEPSVEHEPSVEPSIYPLT